MTTASAPKPQTEKHHLQNDPAWTFSQPNIGFNSFLTVQKAGQKVSEVFPIRVPSYTCREWLLGTIRQTFMGFGAGATVSLGGRVGGPGNSMAVLQQGDGKTGEIVPANLIPVWNAIAGLPTLLISPGRPASETLDTKPESAIIPYVYPAGQKNTIPYNWLSWNGFDNYCITHPTLVALSTGLFRQGVALVAAKQTAAIMAAVPPAEVLDVLIKGDRVEARRMIRTLRPWIQVPAGRGGNLANYSIPWYARKAKQVSFWERFLVLAEALEKRGPEAVFQTPNLHQAWTGTTANGVLTYWGGGQATNSELTANHHHLMALGEEKHDEE